MVEELAEADKAAKKNDATEAQVSRQSACYEVLKPIINAAMRQSGEVEKGMVDFLKTSPILAHYLARRQETD
jgi:hypothetical protein